MAQSALQRRAGFSALVLPAALTLLALSAGNGCQRVLFPEDAPRTQFESHDRLRNRYAPIQEFDEFGRPKPALRSRLSPTEL